MKRAPRITQASGFTLIELLTVVAIIGVLAAILFSVLGRARKAARSAQDSNIMRLIGQSMLQYAADHKGKVNYWGIETGPDANRIENGFWARAWPYLNNDSLKNLNAANLRDVAKDFVSPSIKTDYPELIGNNEGVDYTIAINNTLVNESVVGDHKEYVFQRLQNISRPASAPYATIGVWGFGDLNPYPLPTTKPQQGVYWLEKGGKGVTSVMLDGSVRIWTDRLTNSDLWNRSHS